LASCETNHLVSHIGFTGYDFNNDKDAVWFEGTAPDGGVPPSRGEYSQGGQPPRNVAICSIQSTDRRRARDRRLHQGRFDHRFLTPRLAALSSTSRRLHVGATAWNVFAQMGINPFYPDERPRRDRAL
jgi:hypothetical protein